jgi:taurine dioxygenase
MIRTRPLGKALGAEILDFDLRQPIDPATAKELRDVWHEHQVIVFRDQDITAEDQRRLVAALGTLQPPKSKLERKDADILYVANVKVGEEKGVLPDGEMQFHADQCYYEAPARGAVLYAMEVPSKGGNTCFADVYGAYETLPADLKQRVEGLDVYFVYDYESNVYRRGAVGPDAPRYVHPAVILHPDTGRPLLFVNRLMADHLVGVPREESDAMLETLFDHIERPERVYEHVWRKGDVVIWDNFATLHARTDFDPKERRILRRMAIAGARPQALRERRLAG